MTALILHGGAGARRERNYDAEVVHMRQVVEAMKARLDAGASAVDVAVEAVVMLEDSGLYVAGRGASPNLAGAYELDASLMDGASGKAGLEAHTLECYRSLGGGPVFHKFGKWVRYAVDDLDTWAESCRRMTTASPAAPRILPIDRT